MRVALTRGLPRKQVATGFGIGFSTLNRWNQQDRRNPEKPTIQSDRERESAELQKENRMLLEERDVLEKATVFFAERSKGGLPSSQNTGTTSRGTGCVKSWTSARAVIVPGGPVLCAKTNERTWLSRPISGISSSVTCGDLGSHGRPRMTDELKELRGAVGHGRVGRLMKENDIKVRRNKKFKATTDSNHSFNIAPNLLNRDFSADRPNRKGAGDISYVWTQEGWLVSEHVV